MRGHEHLDVLSNRGLERRQVERFQTGVRTLVAGEGVMGIEQRGAVAGEMLAARQHTGAAQARGQGAAEFGHAIRVRAERAIADDRVVRVGEHVQDRGEVDLYADVAQFVTERGADLEG